MTRVDMLKVTEESTQGLNPIRRNISNKGMQRSDLLLKESTNWLSNIKWPALKNLHTSNITQTERVIFSNIYVYIDT